MNNVKEYRQAHLTGERALFGAKDIKVYDTVFSDGESPLKESENVEVFSSLFRWKYPIWYSNNIKVYNSTWFEMARAGVWYSNNVTVEDSSIQAPKNFRRCNGLSLKNVTMPNAEETLWHCKNVNINNITAKGDYFLMNSENIKIDGMTLYGNYSFDGIKNAEIHSARLITKDAFWNSENVTVYDSFIFGEYLGWNAKNLTLVNCTVESLQGMCYIENLKMKNCKLINTTLAFEYSSVEAEIDSHIDSVMNPKSGFIKANSIGKLILEKDKVDVTKTLVMCKGEEK